MREEASFNLLSKQRSVETWAILGMLSYLCRDGGHRIADFASFIEGKISRHFAVTEWYTKMIKDSGEHIFGVNNGQILRRESNIALWIGKS